MQKSTHPTKDTKFIPPSEDSKDPRNPKNDVTKQTINAKATPFKSAKNQEKKEPEQNRYEGSSQESQNIEFLEKRVEDIIQEAVTMETDSGKFEIDEDVHFEERMQLITTRLQQTFENYITRNEEIENWFREHLTGCIQEGMDKINGFNQGFECTVRERNDLQNQTTHSLGLAVEVQKILKENQRLWNLN